MSKRLSRRALLKSGGLPIGLLIVGGATSRAVADEEIKEADKIKQTDAHYQRFPKGPQRCQICLQYTPPDKCKIVKGPIFPQGVRVLRGERERSLIPSPSRYAGPSLSPLARREGWGEGAFVAKLISAANGPDSTMTSRIVPP